MYDWKGKTVPHIHAKNASPLAIQKTSLVSKKYSTVFVLLLYYLGDIRNYKLSSSEPEVSKNDFVHQHNSTVLLDIHLFMNSWESVF